jgi:hypothetical protein
MRAEIASSWVVVFLVVLALVGLLFGLVVFGLGDNRYAHTSAVWMLGRCVIAALEIVLERDVALVGVGLALLGYVVILGRRPSLSLHDATRAHRCKLALTVRSNDLRAGDHLGPRFAERPEVLNRIGKLRGAVAVLERLGDRLADVVARRVGDRHLGILVVHQVAVLVPRLADELGTALRGPVLRGRENLLGDLRVVLDAKFEQRLLRAVLGYVNELVTGRAGDGIPVGRVDDVLGVPLVLFALGKLRGLRRDALADGGELLGELTR